MKNPTFPLRTFDAILKVLVTVPVEWKLDERGMLRDAVDGVICPLEAIARSFGLENGWPDVYDHATHTVTAGYWVWRLADSKTVRLERKAQWKRLCLACNIEVPN